MQEWCRNLWDNHRNKTVGALTGLALSISLMAFGFFWTLFIALSVFAGYQVGKRLDDEKIDLWEFLDRFLPGGQR